MDRSIWSGVVRKKGASLDLHSIKRYPFALLGVRFIYEMKTIHLEIVALFRPHSCLCKIQLLQNWCTFTCRYLLERPCINQGLSEDRGLAEVG